MMKAHEGTLFLDEIGDMPLEMQVKLLRALEDRRVRAVGSEGEVDWNARVIAATHRDLDRDVEEGRFRRDLFFRLNVVEIELPPLRARGNDVLLLAQEFLTRADATGRIKGLAPEAARQMLSYDWPGNVRELRNCIERGVALARHDHLTVEDLPARIRSYEGKLAPDGSLVPTELMTLEEVQRRYVEHVLREVDGHQTTAAKILGVDRKTLYRRLQAWQKD
jgi:DNA-binding NtrC family response regulator